MGQPTFTSQTHCTACLGKNLATVVEMPGFPMIGVFVDSPDDAGIAPVDQALMICETCGHMQLHNNVDPQILYNSKYFHRSGESVTASAGIDAFVDYVKEVAGHRKFKRLLEVGCNDMYLLRQVSNLADEVFGIDPIWIGEETPSEGNIEVIGGFVEQVDFEDTLNGKPDLVISSMTFEHLKDPHETLHHLIDAAADDAVFVIQVPGTEMILGNLRFDQLTHQHYQQFSLHSFVKMVEACGGRYLSHETNTPYWGAIMIAFTKGSGDDARALFPRHTLAEVSDKFTAFEQHLQRLMDVLNGFGERPIYGFGAAQNVPSLAYFMKSDLGFLQAVLDDDPSRQNKYWPGLKVKTAAPKSEMNLSKAAVLITAPEYARALVGRAARLGVERIVVPAAAF